MELTSNFQRKRMIIIIIIASNFTNYSRQYIYYTIIYIYFKIFSRLSGYIDMKNIFINYWLSNILYTYLHTYM
jgi:hypothetical protein